MESDIFQKALSFVLKWEGGYVNDPNDKGGATNKGITQSTYNSWLRSKGRNLIDVKVISDKDVRDIYYYNYWLKAGCDKMTEKFAILSFDTAINMGVSRVNEFLREAEWKSPEKFLLARIAKYLEFAKVKGQEKFLQGWLNRVIDLYKYI